MMVASHYHWAMWSIGMYTGDSDSYDYLGYALIHYQELLEGYNRINS